MISLKFEFRYESLNIKFSIIPLSTILSIGGCSVTRIEKIIGENAFEQKKKKPGLKCNPGSALI